MNQGLQPGIALRLRSAAWLRKGSESGSEQETSQRAEARALRMPSQLASRTFRGEGTARALAPRAARGRRLVSLIPSGEARRRGRGGWGQSGYLCLRHTGSRGRMCV